MRVGNYSVLVPEGVEQSSGHVALEHGRQYTLRLMNHDHRRCDAEVTIDGKSLGGFRLLGHGQMTLERMPHDSGRLTFYSSGTNDAAAAGEGGISVPDKGLIQVRFVPEKRPAEPVRTVQPVGMVPTMGGGPLLRSRSFGAGGPSAPLEFAPEAEEKTCGGITGLSGHSNQQFVTVGGIDRDEGAAVTISLRLITLKSGPRPLTPAGAVGNPVPEPVQ